MAHAAIRESGQQPRAAPHESCLIAGAQRERFGYSQRVLGAVPCRTCFLALLATCLGCTGSENQVFTPFQKSNVHPPVAGHDADAGPAADSGKPWVLDDDGGTPLRMNTGLDPDAQFIWTETQPGHPGACEPGTYAGSFDCTFDAAGGFTHLIGSIEITLAGQAMSTKLSISDSRVLGFSGASPSFTSSLDGELDCATARFTATTHRRTPLALPASFGSEVTLTTVDGTLAGHFDAEALALAGDIVLSTSEGWKCTGKFHAQLSR